MVVTGSRHALCRHARQWKLSSGGADATAAAWSASTAADGRSFWGGGNIGGVTSGGVSGGESIGVPIGGVAV